MKSRWWGGVGLASRKRELKSAIVRFLQAKGSDSEHQIHLCQPFVLYYHSHISLTSAREIINCLYNVFIEYIDKNIYSMMRSVHGCRHFELIIKLFAVYGLKKKDRESMGYHATFSSILKMILNLNTYELLYW